MNSKTEPQVLTGNKDGLTSVLMLIPTNITQQPKEQFENLLTAELHKAIMQIINFCGDEDHPLIKKLWEKVNELNNYSGIAKSAVIYVAEDEIELFYVNYSLAPKTILNERFSIITLINNSSKHLTDYLAVVLTGCYAKIYRSSGTGLKKIAGLAAENYNYADNGVVKQQCHLSNSVALKKQILAGYTNTIDDALHIFLEEQPLPVFVFGPHSAANYFYENSKYKLHIIEMFTTNYTDINEAFIIELVDLWRRHNLKPCC